MSPTSPTSRRPAARLALAGALMAGAMTLPAANAAADALPELRDPAAAAATWAAGRLTEGTHAGGDHGLTADIVLGLAASGTAGDTADRATDWLAENAADYITRGGGEGTVFAGGAAKLALVAAVEHRDPRDFGGQDLTATLLGRLQDTGRFTDAGTTGDMSNQFSQSLAVLALERTGDVPDSAVDFLASTRCADGGYPLSLRRNPDRCTSDTDSTGMAVQALLAVGSTADAEPALDWLEGRQREDGGFGYDAASAPNANSTALAVQALAAGGREDAARRGETWLRSVQVGCAGAAADRGAVGYTEPVANGLALRATAQAIPALAGQALGEIDGASSAPDTEPIDCTPDDGSAGATTGQPGAGGAANGADADGAANGNTSDGATANGADAGATSGTTTASATTDGAATDGTTDGGTTDGTTATGGASDGTTGGSTSTGTTTSGATTSTTTTGTGPDGNLADTGSSSARPLMAAAALFLLAGCAAYLIARRRRGNT
ncbi:prenyltransferase/squalene oxidase repeat-containing protein [Streptomyces sp. NPDC127098]|uniref:LAETG motif-containing sortase-dependent surface protein n=1 Tax=Streptomyces sp. NPDC127098 TaxID=3347137 RepID=UPI003664B9A0